MTAIDRPPHAPVNQPRALSKQEVRPHKAKRAAKHALPEDRLWSVMDVAYFLAVPVQTVYSWRGQGRGPKGRLVGRRLRYRPEDVREWVAALSTDVA